MSRTKQPPRANRSDRGRRAQKRRALAGAGLVALLSIAAWLAACRAPSSPEPSIAVEPGQISRGRDAYGTFFTYLPGHLPARPHILVLIHGTPPKMETAEWNAEQYVGRWIDAADRHGVRVQCHDTASATGNLVLLHYRKRHERQHGPTSDKR